MKNGRQFVKQIFVFFFFNMHGMSLKLEIISSKSKVFRAV